MAQFSSLMAISSGSKPREAHTHCRYTKCICYVLQSKICVSLSMREKEKIGGVVKMKRLYREVGEDYIDLLIQVC